MNILILNVGSSSIKYSIYSNKLILKGKFEKLRKEIKQISLGLNRWN